MGRTALYRDHVPFHPARAEVQLEPDALLVRLPHVPGGGRRYALDGCDPVVIDGCVPVTRYGTTQRRFVRMLILDRASERQVMITPPDQGAVAPGVVRVPVAPSEAAILELRTWTAITDWILAGGRFAACSIGELAALAAIATPQFAVLIGEVVAQRALELIAMVSHPLRGGSDLESILQPLSDTARESPQAAEALVSALAHLAIPLRRLARRSPAR